VPSQITLPLAGLEGDHVAGNGFAVDGDPLDAFADAARVLDLDLQFRAAQLEWQDQCDGSNNHVPEQLLCSANAPQFLQQRKHRVSEISPFLDSSVGELALAKRLD
jgi:hypothetical protein